MTAEFEEQRLSESELASIENGSDEIELERENLTTLKESAPRMLPAQVYAQLTVIAANGIWFLDTKAEGSSGYDRSEQTRSDSGQANRVFGARTFQLGVLACLPGRIVFLLRPQQ
jgi:hypothetical protein